MALRGKTAQRHMHTEMKWQEEAFPFSGGERKQLFSLGNLVVYFKAIQAKTKDVSEKEVKIIAHQRPLGLLEELPV